MSEKKQVPSLCRFERFELDLRRGELRRDGKPVRLQPKPFKLLTLLVNKSGQLVSRQEIQNQLWGPETYVDFEKGLNFRIRQIREVLGDKAKHPKYIQTVPCRGYRFIPSVDIVFEEVIPSPELASGREISIAVLPFANIGNDPAQEYFADGMTEALIVELAQMRALRVISRTSAMQYKGAQRSLPAIARELGVDKIVEGTVQRSGRRVRIAAQLIDAITDQNLWAHNYERELHDILTLQKEVARTIATEIKVQITPQERERLLRPSSVDPSAYEAYLKGRYYWNKRTEGDVWTAVKYFEDAVHIDPKYAQAYAGLADAYILLGFYEMGAIPPREFLLKARNATEEALKIDDSRAEAHTSLAYIRWVYEWDLPQAETEFKYALSLNPNYSTAQHWYAVLLLAARRIDEAVARAEHACLLDPLSPSVNTSAAWCFYCARKFDQAARQARKVLEVSPDYPMAHTVLGLTFEQEGHYEEAIGELRKAVGISGYPISIASLGHVLAASGDRKGARLLLKKLSAESKRRYVSPYALALIHCGLQQKQEALSLLKKAYRDRTGWLAYIDVEPRFDILRTEGQFRRLRKALGLGDLQ